MNNFEISGNIVDIVNERIFPGKLIVSESKISEIVEQSDSTYDNYILPGFVDAHVHIESSMLTPSEFARMASIHGTVATVSDPHEIANVLGIEGIEFMLKSADEQPFKFYFGVPSCVPATGFETAGNVLDSGKVDELLQNPKLKYLSEMMNFPGVLFDDLEVGAKLNSAKKYNKPIDGHAPGLSGDDLKKYISAGITTDHECFTIEEALEKINLGMKVLIREGSAAKNFDELHSLIKSNTDMVMLCSDDKHPDDLLNGHINLSVKRAVENGHKLMDVLKVAIKNPVEHYGLDIGLLQPGDSADFIITKDLKNFEVIKTYISGKLCAENSSSKLEFVAGDSPNFFNVEKKTVEEFKVEPKEKEINVIEALEGQLITNKLTAREKVVDNNVVSDTQNDILKLAVVNRYENTKPAVAFVKNFGLKIGAIASSVAHDSHNIIAVGADDDSLCKAVNAIIENKGGMAVVNADDIDVLALPIAGLLSADNGFKTAQQYSILNMKVKELGSHLNAPFMTLSFMALLVIPSIKLSDKGLFDGENFEFIDLQVNE